jgi:hypothetical protein
MYKIQWSHHTEEEAMWETEDYLNTKYLGFLQSRNREFFSPSLLYQIESRDEIPLKGVGCDAPGFSLALIAGQIVNSGQTTVNLGPHLEKLTNPL